MQHKGKRTETMIKDESLIGEENMSSRHEK